MWVLLRETFTTFTLVSHSPLSTIQLDRTGFPVRFNEFGRATVNGFNCEHLKFVFIC